jgi:hypothetical protein
VNGSAFTEPEDCDADVIASTRRCAVTSPRSPASSAPSSIGCITRVARSL